MTEAQNNEEKKIIVDEDWKAEAKREKEKLAAELDSEPQGEPGGRPPLPEGNFAALVSMLVTQTMFALGALQIEGQEPQPPDFEMARYHIDMLGTLEDKTRGNLSDEEARVLKDTLNQMRMAFVQVAGIGEEQEP